MPDSSVASEKLPPPVYVADAAALERLIQTLQDAQAVGVDTESNSLYAYRERVCLIQFSVPGTDYILDPLCFQDLSALRSFFANPLQEKIFHAAEYDILCLKRDYNFEFSGIFDTMVAARTLAWPQSGLAAILESRFGVKMNKRFQRADWSFRPLTQDLLEYARLDTRYLLPLRDLQMQELLSLGRQEEASEEFERLTRVRSESNGPDPHGFWRIRGARELQPFQLAVLRELYLYREAQSERADRPPFKIMSDRTLLEIAQNCPRRIQGLKHIHGMTHGQVRRFGEGLLRAVQAGKTAPHPRPPVMERAPRKVRERYDLLFEWRKEKARARGVESDVVLPRNALWELARLDPHQLSDLEEAESLGPWRRRTYGPEILELLRKAGGGKHSRHPGA